MANVAYRSFQSGELSPAMYARADLQRYATGLRTLRNATVLRTGGVQNRAGFEYLGTTKADGAARLVEAVFDTTSNFVLEFGNLYVRFWKDGALVQIPTPSAWVTATPYTVGTLRSNGGTNYLCIGAHTSGASTEPGVGASWQTVWHELEGLIYEWPTPYTAAQLNDLQFAYQLNVVTIVHPSHAPATLTRSSDADWTLADVDFTTPTTAPDNVAVSGTSGTDWGYTVTAIFADGTESGAGAYVRTNLSSGGVPFAIYTALAAAPRTVTWDAVADAVSYKVYANEGNFSLTEVRGTGTGLTFVDNGGFAVAFADPPTPTGNFQAANDYPSVVAAYQQRLLLAGTNANPDIAYASQVAKPYNFAESNPLVDSDAMEWRQIGRRLNRIRHFVEVAQRLFQFSDIGEAIVQGDTDGVLRPGEVNPRQFSENGAASYPAPLVVNDTALYVQARGSVVRDLSPAQFDGFAGSDLTLQAAHLVDGLRLVAWCYQQTPDSVVWVVRDDGTLLSLTYVRELGILGWATHDTDGFVESVCCIPEGGRDAVYAVIQRTIDGNTVRYVERMSDRLATNPMIADAAVQAGGTVVEAGTITFSDNTAPSYTAVLSADAFFPSEVGNTFGVENLSGDIEPFTLTSLVGASEGELTHYADGMAWAEYLGLFIAVDGDKVSTSPDGKTWTLRYDAAGSPDYNAVAVSESLERVVVVGRGGTAVYSDDCITWAACTVPEANDWYGICWGESAARFVAVGRTGTNRAMYSTDGITFVASGPPAEAWTKVVFSETSGLYVAVAARIGGGNVDLAMSSPDGQSWTQRTTPNITVDWLGLAVDDATGRIVAVGNDVLGAGQAVMTSDNGTSWTARTTSTVTRTNWRSVVYAATYDLWIAGAFTNTTEIGPLMVSDDGGVTWANVDPLLPLGIVAGNPNGYNYPTVQSLAYSDSLGVFVGGQSQWTDTFVSADAVVWVRNVASQTAIVGFDEALPSGMVDVALSPWYRGILEVSGLTHLIGEAVSIVADGVVIASPNNSAYATVTIASDTYTLAASALSVTVGLPYTTDIQTLDIDSVGTTVKDRGMQVGGVICWVEDTGQFYAGPIVPTGDTLTGLEAFVPTNDEGYATTSNVTGVAEVTLQATYNNTGRVLIRQVDPVPLTILSIAPTGFLNGGR